MNSKKYPSSTNTLGSRLKKWAAYGALLGLIFGLIYFAPASWLGLYIEHLSQDKISLVQTSGTVWDGSAQVMLKPNAREFTDSNLGGATPNGLGSLDLSDKSGSELLIASPFSWHIAVELSLSRLVKGSVRLLSGGLSNDPGALVLRASVENSCCLQSPLVVTLSPELGRDLGFSLGSGLALNKGGSEVSGVNGINGINGVMAAGDINPSGASSPPTTSALSSGLVLYLSDSESNWPAQWLGGLGAPWNTVAPKGTLNLQTIRTKVVIHPFSAEPAQFRGEAQITFKDLSSQLSTLEPLGTYLIKLSEPRIFEARTISGVESQNAGLAHFAASQPLLGAKDGVTLHLSVETLEGRLELTGEGDWTDHHLHFNGMAKAQTGFEAALANLLSILGPRHDNTATLKIG